MHFDPFEKEIMNKTWLNNPKFHLLFNESEQAIRLKVTLAIADKSWKSQTKNAVGGMIGLYLLEKQDHKIGLQDMIREPSFMPVMSVSEDYELNPNIQITP